MITDHAYVRDLILKQQKKGIDVTQHDFKLSSHVDHIRPYPQEYASLLLEFVSSKCNMKDVKEAEWYKASNNTMSDNSRVNPLQEQYSLARLC